MSHEGVEDAKTKVTDRTVRTSSYNDLGNLAQAVAAVAWGLVAIAEALDKDDATN